MCCLDLCRTASSVAPEKGWSCFKPKLREGCGAFHLLIEVFVKARNKIRRFLTEKVI